MSRRAVFTLADARAERMAHDARMERRDARVQARKPSNPAVGVLCRRGRPVYYAFIAGTYTESRDLAAIEAKLEGGAL